MTKNTAIGETLLILRVTYSEARYNGMSLGLRDLREGLFLAQIKWGLILIFLESSSVSWTRVSVGPFCLSDSLFAAWVILVAAFRSVFFGG
jgi:hypothetical protein